MNNERKAAPSPELMAALTALGATDAADLPTGADDVAGLVERLRAQLDAIYPREEISIDDVMHACIALESLTARVAAKDAIIEEQRLTIAALMVGMPEDGTTPVIRRIAELETVNASLLQQAQIWKQEAMAQRATVHEAYRVCTGSTGEPGDWNGALPIRALAAERDALRSDVLHWGRQFSAAMERAEKAEAEVARLLEVATSATENARELADCAERLAAVESSPIDSLLAEYAAESSDFSGPEGYAFALKLARRYAERGPDSQMRCVVHTLLSAPVGVEPVGLLYAERDHIAQGDDYLRHVSATSCTAPATWPKRG